jgi:hypothetical protein
MPSLLSSFARFLSSASLAISKGAIDVRAYSNTRSVSSRSTIPNMSSSINEAIKQSIGKDDRIKLLRLQRFLPGDPLVPSRQTAGDADPRSDNGVTLLKLFIRTDSPADSPLRPTAGTDVGVEIWLPDPEVWNKRVRVQIQGGFMGDAKITAPDAFSDTPCGAEMSMAQVAAEKGYIVATTDGGHQASTYEDMSYLTNSDGSPNTLGWKNIAWQATRLTRQVAKDLAQAYYQQSPSYFYLFGCSTGGRQAYHIAQQHPADFDGYLVSCPSLTQTLLFPSLIHPHIVIQNDLNGEHFRPGQLEQVSRRALAAGDTSITGSHDGYITHW